VKEIKMRKLLIPFFIILFCGQALAATYYIDDAGTETVKENAVSCTTALSVAGYNAESYSPGDDFILCNGTYDTTQITARVSGTSTNPSYIQGESKTGTIVSTISGDYSLVVIVRNYVYIKDITFINPASGYSSIRALRTQYLTVDNCDFSDPGDAGGRGIWFYGGNGYDVVRPTIKNCAFDDMNAEPIFFGLFGAGAGAEEGTLIGPVIQNNRMTNIDGSGIWILGAVEDIDPGGLGGDTGISPYGIDIKNNYMNNITGPWVQIGCGTRNTEANYIRNNMFLNSGTATRANTNGLQIGWLRNFYILDNIFIGVTTNVCDGSVVIIDWRYSDDLYISNGVTVARNRIAGGIGTGCTGKGLSIFKGKNVLAYNNLIYNNDLGVRQADPLNTGNILYNNTIVDNLDDGLLINSGAAAITLVNNIIWDNAGEQIDNDSANEPVVSYSVINATDYSGFTHGAVEINTDPILNIGYSLQPGSSAINVGSNLGSPYNIDFYGRNQNDFGSNWEIGAKAYVRSPKGTARLGMGLNAE